MTPRWRTLTNSHRRFTSAAKMAEVIHKRTRVIQGHDGETLLECQQKPTTLGRRYVRWFFPGILQPCAVLCSALSFNARSTMTPYSASRRPDLLRLSSKLRDSIGHTGGPARISCIIIPLFFSSASFSLGSDHKTKSAVIFRIRFKLRYNTFPMSSSTANAAAAP